MSRATNSSIRPFLGAVAVAALFLIPSARPALAQSGQSAPSQQPQAQSQTQGQEQMLTSSQVDDPTLEQFTRSYLAIMKIQQKMKDDLANEKDQAKAQQIRQNASQQEIQVLKDHQLTVDKFNQILKSIPKDQDLGKRFVAMQSKVQQG